jgi:hypothetical protein
MTTMRTAADTAVRAGRPTGRPSWRLGLALLVIAAAAIRTGREHPIKPANSHAVPGPDDATPIPAR